MNLTPFAPAQSKLGAMPPLAPGDLLTIANGSLVVTVAPSAGGRIAQMTHRGRPLLVEYGPETSAMNAWGMFPMVPWAGRVRDGRFDFQGDRYQLPPNLDEHAVHGAEFGPRAPKRMDTCPAARLMMLDGIKNGEILRGPPSRKA